MGPRVASKLEKLGIRTVQDVFFHLPLRYQDRTRVVAIGNLRVGQEVVVEAQVAHTEVVYRKRRSLLVHLADGTDGLTLRFFHFNASQQWNLGRGVWLRAFGEVRRGPQGLEMVHPEYRRVDDNSQAETEQHLTPIYPATEGLHQLTLRKLSAQALDWLQRSKRTLIDWIPDHYLQGPFAYSLHEAVAFIHRPPPDADVARLAAGRHPAQRRLAFEELLAQQLTLVRLRAQLTGRPAPALLAAGRLFAQLQASLPFALTRAQQRVIKQVAEDLGNAHPMLRLVQGDVGSGKTVVAAAACLHAVEAGFQAALMAPTELLAEQHYRSFAAWVRPLGLTLGWLSGKLKVAERQQMLALIAGGEADIVIGTHALFQEDVNFKDLALVIIDEQHRFGVHQRLAFKQKGHQEGRYPHQLIMTATPIPRTLAMTAYADLDYSVIDELPPGRTPVKTVAVPDTRRHEVIARVSHACEQGRQAYWVCTLIEESEALQRQAAEDTAAALSQALPQLEVALVHGRLRPEDKDAVMQRFKAGEINLLVATTVIEVGVDVPNASLMIIENAERLGLAQLHQLRGRVGRGSVESNCVLMYHPPLSDQAKRRLRALRETTDGFEIARIDLELRGPGEVLGTRQTGMLQLRIAELVRDQDLLPAVQETAKKMLANHPEHVEPLIRRWLGESVQFGQV